MTENKLNAKNRELFTIVYGASDVLHNSQADFIRTAARAENGEERYKEITAKLDKLIADIIQTIPPIQCHTIAKQMEVSELKFSTKRAMAKEDQYWAVDRNALSVLVESAISNTCLLCDGKKQKCPLKSVIDDMPVIIEDANLYIACREGELDV